MRVMVIVKANEESEAGTPPDEQMLTEMGKFNEELARAGVILDAAGLKPSSSGFRVHFKGDTRTVTDGPFAETKELIAGYWVWQVRSIDEALEWAKRIPNPTGETGTVEIRPFFEAEDFGESFTPELREQEARVAAKAAENRQS